MLSGTFAAIAAAETKLTAAGVATRKLKTSHAYHSATMQPMVTNFEAEMASISLQAPQIPFVSSVSGEWITGAQATDPSYWAQQCVLPVRFAAAVKQLEAGTMLEIGMGETLTTLALQGGVKLAVASLGKDKVVQSALAELWKVGVAIDWRRYFAGEHRRRTSLPTYPFERKLHWIEPPARAQVAATQTQDEVGSMSVQAESGAAESVSGITRNLQLRDAIAQVLTDLSGIATTPGEADYQFLELGFDSLFLTQATQVLSRKFAVKLTFRQMMEEFSSIAALADHLDHMLPAEAFAPASVAPKPTAASTLEAAPTGLMERLLADQLAAMSKLFAEQVATLKAAAGVTSIAEPALNAAPVTKSVMVASEGEVRMVRPAKGAQAQDLTPTQTKYVAELIAKYEARTPGSKQQTQQGRAQLADPRAVAGFRPGWKEMVYPLITERGPRLAHLGC